MRLGRRGLPVVHRHDHERRPAARLRLVPGALERARHVLGAHRLVDPDRVFAGEPGQLPCQERLVGEVAPVLLADGDDQRRAVDARGRQRRDRVSEAGRRVQEHERGLSASERIAGRDPDHRALVQREHELEIRGQVDEERHLGRAGVGEDLRHPAPPQDLERGVSDRHRCRSPRRGPIGPHLGAAHVAGEPTPPAPEIPRAALVSGTSPAI